jgi:hypothetical protein
MKLKKKYTFVVEKTETGFSAFSEESPIYTTGKNITDLQKNIVEAMQLANDETTIDISSENIELEIDIKQLFKFYRVINSKFLAERIGMNPTLLSQYVIGIKKPSRKQTDRILTGIHEIGKELSEIKLTN